MCGFAKILLEVCVDSVESAVTAQKNGAGRIELCADLIEGGITPSFAMIKVVREKLTIPVNVLIRPRGGDFLYSDYEFEVMKQDVLVCRELGINGVVIGMLDEDGAVDELRMGELVSLARPMSITFHRAFDLTRDPYAALKTLIHLGIERVLTSGQEDSAEAGIDLLANLIRYSENEIIIMPGSGVNEKNAAKIVLETGAKEIHASMREKFDSAMKYRKNKVAMGNGESNREYLLSRASGGRIKKLTEILYGIEDNN